MASDDPRRPDDATRLAPGSGGSDGVAVTSSSGWLSSSGEIDHGRFPPGTLLGGRYRIVGRAGRGGMGEVYRADDLKLGQPVALKFLAADLDRDAARLTQLHTEVRMARQVSHPNVCRVYDIDEVDGHTFLSMEYVDGEELSSALRRFGRFSPDRALEVARQICAGLAAAHERGVVHRDFKPANVMLDATGKVRITDFGLAGASGESLRAGTPAYMAPEQLSGTEVTIRSDIYALGLVLYELFTGQRAFEAKNVAELLRKRDEGPVPPSAIVRDLDSAIDRAIARCLALNPADRPPSALAVAASLPGGDPLAAALAAGETPSPEMVAASGSTSALTPGRAIAGLALSVVFLAAYAALSDRALLTSYVPLEKPPEVLADRARQISRELGHTSAVVDTASGFTAAEDYLGFMSERGEGAAARSRLQSGRPAGLLFWHRSSPKELVPIGTDDRVTRWNPPLTTPDMRLVVVDTEGRLVEFHAVPAQIEESGAAPAERAQWDGLFRLADLKPADFQTVAPRWTPPVHSDERAAWEAPLPGWPNERLRLEAAAYKGRPVFFRTIGPWTKPESMGGTPPSRTQAWVQSIVAVAILVVLAGATLVGRHNLRKGRVDRRGAFKISSVIFATSLFAWVTESTHVSSVNQEMGRFFTAIGMALFAGGMLWLLYVALEPYVRKFWPSTLVSWSRLLAGEYRDPLVGRDILIGTLLGVAAVLLGRLWLLIAQMLGYPPLPPEVPSVLWLQGVAQMLATVANLVFSAMFNALWIIFALVAVNLVIRRVWITALLMSAFLLVTSAAGIAQSRPVWLGVVISLAVIGLIVLVIFRFGLLATVTFFLVEFVLSNAVLTLDTSKWFFPISATLMLLVVALAAYGFYASRGGEPLIGRRILE